MAGEKVLIVDDEIEIRELISTYLKRENIQSIECENGKEALLNLKENTFDLVILDIMMEDMDGYEVLKHIRSQYERMPVIFLSARQEEYDKVLGFGLGADDYVTKPFSPGEFTARVKAHLRREKRVNAVREEKILTVGELKLDLNTYVVTKGQTEIKLSGKEFKLLQFFMEHPNKVFTKVQIYRQVWEQGVEDDNAVMVYMSHLREKIEDDPKRPQYIQTIRGIGYRLQSEWRA
ncbi:MAG: response regulator transcription factor [Cellulosilyticum sp.]|nr:response regulator transcription factor [Cellulosilyticum sp.]